MTVQPSEHSAPRRSPYTVVFAILAIFTAIEVAVGSISDLPHALKIVLLVFLAAGKVLLVALYFMHLKYDFRAFRYPLFLAAFLAVLLVGMLVLWPPDSGEAQLLETEEAPGSEAGEQVINAVEVNYAINLSADHAPAGEITFHVTNKAPDVPHELTVFRTDLPPDQLPVVNGVVDEQQVKSVGSTDDLAPGQSADLTVKLDPGAYVLVCNIPGHYGLGMFIPFTVEGEGGAATETPAATEESTEAAPATEQPTEQATEQPTEQATEQPAPPATEQAAEPTTEPTQTQAPEPSPVPPTPTATPVLIPR